LILHYSSQTAVDLIYSHLFVVAHSSKSTISKTNKNKRRSRIHTHRKHVFLEEKRPRPPLWDNNLGQTISFLSAALLFYNERLWPALARVNKKQKDRFVVNAAATASINKQ
jgi:hypothetical protein